jgi:hypothetical protein
VHELVEKQPPREAAVWLHRTHIPRADDGVDVDEVLVHPIDFGTRFAERGLTSHGGRFHGP